MNPNENNPTSPAGTSGTDSGTGSVDFTNPTSLNSSSSLSMTDSLASAQDSLTSAGQAAISQPDAIGLNQIGADAPSAAMDRPNQPLTPAAPVPGSIGSVTSVPAAPSTDPLVAASANAAPATPPVTNVTSSNMPTMGTAASSTSSAQPYFNPFAPRPSMKGNGPEPSTDTANGASMPPTLQPPTDKFANHLNAAKEKHKGGSGVIMVIAWLLAVVCAVAAVFFFIQWQDAEKRASEKEIVYIEKQPEVAPTTSLTCALVMDAQEEGVENLVDRNRRMNAIFNDGQIQEIDLVTDYTFTDNDAAEAARGFFDTTAQYFADLSVGLPAGGITVAYDVKDNVGTYWLNAKSDQLVGEYIAAFGLPTDADGKADTTSDGIKQVYEGAGYTCSVSE